eukprot:EC097301.1.p3 GENE.EC097301.1~~EC097301.1.p3  ORF type:complete len:103 (+),score=4.54 EC097301.1:365-673(+)
MNCLRDATFRLLAIQAFIGAEGRVQSKLNCLCQMQYIFDFVSVKVNTKRIRIWGFCLMFQFCNLLRVFTVLLNCKMLSDEIVWVFKGMLYLQVLVIFVFVVV